MDELIFKLHKTTLAMEQAIAQGDYQKLDKLLDERNSIIGKVDSFKAENEQYSPRATVLLREIEKIDRQITTKLIKSISETEAMINQQMMNKQVSKKFQPYSIQTSGVFLDEKK